MRHLNLQQYIGRSIKKQVSFIAYLGHPIYRYPLSRDMEYGVVVNISNSTNR